MSDLSRRAAALREALPHAEVAEITVDGSQVEILVYENVSLARLRRAARTVGISDEALRIIRPVVFLEPYPDDDPANEAALQQFLAENVQVDAKGNGVQFTSIKPVIGAAPRVLILGSMPGEISLKVGEYYANRQNRFWPVMEAVLDMRADDPYHTRASQLTAAGVALWDVLKHCRRVGSLDTRIQPRTEVPNDIAELLERHPTIDRIVFNGKKAERSFDKLVKPSLSADVQDRVGLAVAPSTSAANARSTLPALVEAWRAALELTA